MEWSAAQVSGGKHFISTRLVPPNLPSRLTQKFDAGIPGVGRDV